MSSAEATGSPSAFSCHGCGACCTGLRERGTAQGFAELAPGVYRLPTPGGLRVLAWEADVFDEAELKPAVVVADKTRDELVVLCYELEADTCPNLEPETNRCTVYADRPLVCRAFPLIVEPGQDGSSIAASSVCGARVPMEELDEGRPRAEALAEAYPQAFAPALAVPQLWRWLLQLVAFLAEMGAVDPREGLDPETVEAMAAATSIVERAEAAGVVSEGELAERAEQRVEQVREAGGRRQR